MKIDIAGVLVDKITKEQVINELDKIVRTDRSVYLVTAYSEMIIFAQRDETYKRILNNAFLTLPDGFGILWAAKFHSLQPIAYYLQPLSAFFQLIYSLIRALFDKSYFRTVLPEVITGSRLIWDIAKLASEKNYSLALVGGTDSVAAQSANELKKVFPNLHINLTLSGDLAFNEKTVKEIAVSNSDILLIAYSPPRQEIWLSENLQALNVKVAIGLGGTFDYISGHKKSAPITVHKLGLEWLWRLITQPYRIKRIWNAVPVFVWKIYKYKVKMSKIQ